MPHRILILGAGAIGSALVADLASRGNQVTAADVSEACLRRVAGTGVRTVQADLSTSEALSTLAAEHDVAVNALPSAMGYQALRTLIEGGKNVVDITFMPEDALALAPLARQRGVAAVVDCGVGPGLSHMLAGFAARELSPCDRIVIYVGGLPVERRWPHEYKAGFSVHDVIEEYVRPARVVRDGRVEIKDALSEPELLDISGVGIVEAFLTDGLRTLVATLDVPFMEEKTLRYPGHRDLMRAFRESGLFSADYVEAGGQKVRPVDTTAAVLATMWRFEEGEPDVTILRVVAEGRKDGARVRYTWDMVDRYEPATRMRSMSRATAFPAAAVAGLVAEGVFAAGVHAPEAIGRTPGLLERVLGELETRGIRCVLRVD